MVEVHGRQLCSGALLHDGTISPSSVYLNNSLRLDSSAFEGPEFVVSHPLSTSKAEDHVESPAAG